MCMHCYLAGLGHCKCNIPAHPGMEYLGDETPSLQPCGLHQVKQAHLMVADGDGPGFVRSEERVVDPVMTRGWTATMRVVWHLPNPKLVSSILWALQDFVAHHNCLYSERQPHDTWVEPTVDERLTRATLAAPPNPMSYVDV